MPIPLTPDNLRAAPKVLLHDHLDGGLRPATVIELADAAGYRDLPTTDPEELDRWFVAAADSGSLVRYLETFAHTCAVLQDEASLVRVASECVQDLAADGVVYAEVRYAPELHVERGMSLDAVVQAVQDGFRAGERLAAAAGRPIRIGMLLCALRQNARS
ncbi:MAG TPA: adenosine deaminase, partial [Pseudonocardiaceae bacterium]